MVVDCFDDFTSCDLPQVSEAAELKFRNSNFCHGGMIIERVPWRVKEKSARKGKVTSGWSLALINEGGLPIAKNWVVSNYSFPFHYLEQLSKNQRHGATLKQKLWIHNRATATANLSLSTGYLTDPSSPAKLQIGAWLYHLGKQSYKAVNTRQESDFTCMLIW